MPNRKTDTNNNCAVSTDYIGMNYDYPDADYADAREDLRRSTSRYQQGLMWTLANHPRVPQKVRDEMASGAWRRTSSPTTATGRTRSTSARPGG